MTTPVEHFTTLTRSLDEAVRANAEIEGLPPKREEEIHEQIDVFDHAITDALNAWVALRAHDDVVSDLTGLLHVTYGVPE